MILLFHVLISLSIISIAIFKRCLELGINLIDTAEVYRAKNPDGTIKSNEAVIGKAVNQLGRDNFVICTKHAPGGRMRRFTGNYDFKKEDVRNIIKTSCEGSLKELNIDCIDLYYLHRMYPQQINVTIEEVMEVFKGKLQNLKHNVVYS